MKIMLGSMNESSIGTAAMAQLLPLVDYADLDGPLLLADDNGEGITFDNGEMFYGRGNGLGVSVKPL
jgi:L-alanine-DL-glutamate epimerase-like enolase superfamily enzyme